MSANEDLDEAAFTAGYLAALEDIGGPYQMFRSDVIWADLRASAATAYRADGADWVTARLAEQGLRTEEEVWDMFLARRKVSIPEPSSGGQVYVLADADANRVKIGWTGDDVDKRRRAIEQASGTTLHVLATVDGKRVDEAAAHARFAESRIRGEWFNRTPEIDAWIGTL